MSGAKRKTRRVAAGEWREVPPLLGPRHDSYKYRMKVGLLPDGAVLVRGGCQFVKHEEKKILRDELRDPDTGAWRRIPRPMADELEKGVRREAPPAAKVSWTKWSASPIDQLAYPRSGDVRVLLDDGAILVAAGFQTADNMGPFEGTDEEVAGTFLFRPNVRPHIRWAGDLAVMRTGAKAVKLSGGRVLLVGGRSVRQSTSYASVELWEPA